MFCKLYNSNPFLFSETFSFRSTICQKPFTEISLQMVSVPGPDSEYAPLSRPSLFHRDLNTPAAKLNLLLFKTATLNFKIYIGASTRPLSVSLSSRDFKTRRIRSDVLIKQSSCFHEIYSVSKSSIWKATTSGPNCAD